MWNVEHHAEALVVSSESVYWKRCNKSSKKENVRTDFCRQDKETKEREKTEDNVRKYFEDVNTNVK